MQNTHPSRSSPLRDPRTLLTALAFWVAYPALMHTVAGIEVYVDGERVSFGSWPWIRQLAPSYGGYWIATLLALHLAPGLVRLRGWRFWRAAIALVAALATVHGLLLVALSHGDYTTMPAMAVAGIVPHGAIVGVAVLLAERRVATDRERTALHARLHALRNQLQPHFLFNTLQAIGTTAVEDGPTAARMTALLGDLLRRSIRAPDRERITLAEELEHLEPYLELLRVRFGDRLTIACQVPPTLLTAAVPDLTLQPLVENAVEHGIERRSGAGRIRITATLDRRMLRIEVADDGPGVAAANDASTGVGLSATRERIAALFGPEAELRLETNDAGGTTAIVRLPLREVADAA